MHLADYIRIIRKQWWIVLLVSLTAATAAYGFSKLRPRIYRSQAVYAVLFNRLDTGGNIFANQLLNSYVTLIYQPDPMQAINDQLKLDKGGEWLMEYVRVQPQPETRKIVIEADYFDPVTARNIARAVGEMLTARVAEANRTLTGEDRVSLQLAQSAREGYLAKPTTRINVVAGAILGLVLGTLLAFALEYLDDTLKTAADVERWSGLVTVGAIPGGSARGNRRRARFIPNAGLIAGSDSRERDLRS